jgi:hypothetical protein
MSFNVNIEASSSEIFDLSIAKATSETNVTVSDGADINLTINNVSGNRIVARQNDHTLNVPIILSKELSVESKERMIVSLIDPNEYIYRDGQPTVDWGEILGTLSNQTDLINYIASVTPFQTVNDIVTALNTLSTLSLNASVYSSNVIYAGSSSPDRSAVMQADSTSKGFLPPRMSSEQRDNIDNPASGLIIFNTTTGTHQGYNGEGWSNMYE